ncbi:MAG: hypothetical protein AB1649_10060 [Chloroflexota bacterium]
MSHQAGTQDQTALTQSIKSTLASAKQKTAGIRQTDSRLFLTSVVSPATATLISSLAAAIGGNNIFRQATVLNEDGGWILACTLVAIFGFIATLSGVFKKQVEDRLTMANQCVGRLLSLDTAIATGSIGWDEAAKEYREILKAFPEFIS